jgi:proteasome lid subunit RPN8/RPN11
MLRLPQQIINDIIDHAQHGLPEEICGYLAGKEREVLKRFPLENIDHSREHFSFEPSEQFQTVRQVRKEGLIILANYHSHPETPARPSKEDIRLAFDPNISYVIVSLANEIPDLKSFRIRNGEVEKEEIEVF